MSANFERIKKKRTVTAIINSCIIAVACFAIFYGVFMLLTKLEVATISLPIQLAVSIGAGLIVGGTVALITIDSKKRLAEELDDTYSLNERIQTMVSFENDDGYVTKLQREDTERHLENVNGGKPFIKQFGAALVSLVLAVAIMLPAVLVPKAEHDDGGGTQPPAYVQPFELASWQLDRLMKLIEKVEAAEIDETFKEETTNELKRLVNVLKNTSIHSEMLAEVISSIILVDASAEKTATYKLIATALFSAKPTTDEATKEVTDPQTYKQIKSLARYLVKLNAIDFAQDTRLIKDYFMSDSVITDETDDVVPDTETREAAVKVISVNDKLTNFKSEIIRTLDDKTIPEGDPIKAYLLSFAEKLGACCDIANEKDRQSQIEKIFDEMSDNVGAVLTAQYENKAIRDDVISTLMALFGIDKSMLPKLPGEIMPSLQDGSESEGGEESGSISGGYGEGNELWGSNDTIYDPFGEGGAGHKLYGEVFDDYYKKISELLSDESLSEETRQAIAEYFKKLSDGTKK